jgi:hypothetical protein
VLLVCRFAVPETEAVGFTARARRALELLSAQSGALGGQLGRAADDATRWVLVVRFESLAAYRRALSPFDVREHVVPLLSEALPDEPAGYELLLDAEGGTVEQRISVLASDAGTVRVGEGAGRSTAR